MKLSTLNQSLAAALVLATSAIASTPTIAQNANPGTIPYPAGSINPFQIRRTIQLAPTAVTPAPTPSNPVTFAPGMAPVGAQVYVRTNGNLGGVPIFVTYSARPYGAGVATFSTRLSGAGNLFTSFVPRQLCYYGAPTWEVFIKLSNGREFSRVATFRPTNCPR